MNQEQAKEAISELEGQYLTFSLSQEQYGVPILKVVEIINTMQITPVPRSPHYLKGAINLRGQIIPVVDLRLRFGLPERAYDDNTCIIVMRVLFGDRESPVGVVVDTVVEVVELLEANLTSAPTFGSHLDTKFVRGIGKYADGGVAILVDIDCALGSIEGFSEESHSRAD